MSASEAGDILLAHSASCGVSSKWQMEPANAGGIRGNMAATAISQDLRFMELKTPLGANVVVINGLSGAEAISRPFQFTLELLADAANGPVKAKDLLGKAVSIS